MRKTKVVGITFLAGLAIIVLGMFIALSSRNLFNFVFLKSLSGTFPILPKHFNFYQEVLVGLSIALIGAIITGISARKVIPDVIGEVLLPIPKFRFDKIAIGALGLAFVSHSLLYWHLFHNKYTHWDILFFIGGLFLIGLALYRFDAVKTKSILRFTWLDALAILGLIVFCVLINSVNLTHWSFSGIGDEHPFFISAANIVQGEPWNFFQLNYIYNAYSSLESVYQALFMKIFGIHIVSWRLSEVFIQAITAVLLYLLGVFIVGRLTGFVAGFVMASSHYTMAFNVIGYDNTHTYVYAMLVVLMVVLAWRTQRTLFTFLIGVAMAFCLWTTWITLFIWPIVALTLFFNFFQRPTKSQIYAGMLIISGLLITALPALIVTPSSSFLANLHKGTTFGGSEDSGLSLPIYRPDLLYVSFTSFWVNDHSYDHYVYGPFVDHISGVLLLAGLLICLFRFRNYSDKMFFLWFVLGILLVQLSNNTDTLKITRLLFVLPVAAMLVGITISNICTVMRCNLGISKFIVYGVLIIILLLIPILNLYQLSVQGYNQRGLGLHGEALKMLHDYPDYKIIKVGTHASKHDDWFIVIMIKQLYPWYVDRYDYLNLTDVPGNYTESIVKPVYYTGEYDIGQNLSARLPDYKMIKNCGPNQQCRLVFMPTSVPNQQ